MNNIVWNCVWPISATSLTGMSPNKKQITFPMSPLLFQVHTVLWCWVLWNEVQTDAHTVIHPSDSYNKRYRFLLFQWTQAMLLHMLKNNKTCCIFVTAPSATLLSLEKLIGISNILLTSFTTLNLNVKWFGNYIKYESLSHLCSTVYWSC